ncbi:hypothetical protein FQR65_LT12945 [Abscondita terminalis]|nr:hypothetical protein FQR65_LT12945 [Abscondita terminalis]
MVNSSTCMKDEHWSVFSGCQADTQRRSELQQVPKWTGKTKLPVGVAGFTICARRAPARDREPYFADSPYSKSKMKALFKTSQLKLQLVIRINTRQRLQLFCDPYNFSTCLPIMSKLAERYKVYEFEDTSQITVLPISWVNNNSVKYDAKKATEYIKNGKLPYKKWPVYNIKPICHEAFVLQNIVTAQSEKIDNLTSMVKEQKETMATMMNAITELFKKKNINLDIPLRNEYFTFVHSELPLGSIADMESLEIKLQEEKVVEEFKQFLLQLGGNNLKNSVKSIIKNVYTLEVQSKINYTGREGKFGTGNLRQTKIIIEVMQRNSGKTAVQATEEYMYHMQHVSDRIRSKKNKKLQLHKIFNVNA